MPVREWESPTGRHSVAECTVRASELRCERCNNLSTLSKQAPHRSGVCPYSWEVIHEAERRTLPPSSANIANIDGCSLTDDDLPELEIFALATTDDEQHTWFIQPRTPILVGVPQSTVNASVLALWDSGASANFVRIDVLEALAAKAGKEFSRPPSRSRTVCATLADNKTKIELLGVCSVTVTSPKTSAVIRAHVTTKLAHPLVIGVPGLSALGASLRFDTTGDIHITTGHVLEDPPKVSSRLEDPSRGALCDRATTVTVRCEPSRGTNGVSTIPSICSLTGRSSGRQRTICQQYFVIDSSECAGTTPEAFGVELTAPSSTPSSRKSSLSNWQICG